MTWWEATLWGLTGGAAAGLVSFASAVKAASYTWPSSKTLGPRLTVDAISVVLGGLVAAAAHSQMSGPWPAFIFGITAPATIRGVLSGVEVTPRSHRPADPTVPSQAQAETLHPSVSPREGGVREDIP
ncbi:hypothetical protein QNN03_26995 [Streptomyces sp. GXMU-J15]|uniref:Uncharacterized protein n=1 Tax=Streptomyces fuscus TaxID=3048495 RepID=A0ABT7J5E5_9ACTN|nr:hypothetical protein [Streptomyces fuscus]MDL2080094.1 hypothetical protein [Streptomyces fuscus]